MEKGKREKGREDGERERERRWDTNIVFLQSNRIGLAFSGIIGGHRKCMRPKTCIDFVHPLLQSG